MVMANGSSPDLHVLAVDDSLVERMVIERLLKSFSCKVTVVDSGRRALQILGLDDEKNASVGFDALKVNLIMTDYSMPGMTGYELLKKIKESSAFREIPVVIMSSERILARINRCLEEGAEDFLAKPVKPSDVKRLKELLIRGGELEKNQSSTKKRLRDPDHAISEQPSSLLPVCTCDLGQSESILDNEQPSSNVKRLKESLIRGGELDRNGHSTMKRLHEADHTTSEQPSCLSPTRTCHLGQSESMLDNEQPSSDVKHLKESLARGGELDKNRSNTKKRVHDIDHAISVQPSPLSLSHTCNLGQSESILDGDHVDSAKPVPLVRNTLGCDRDQGQSLRESSSSLSAPCSSSSCLVAYSSKRLKIPDIN